VKVTSLAFSFITKPCLNASRKELLSREMADEFPIVGDVMPAEYFTMAKSMLGHRIVFGEEDFSLVQESENVVPDFFSIIKDLSRIDDLLLLDQPKNGIVRLTAVEDITDDVFEWSINSFLSDLGKAFSNEIDATGVGLRFVIKRDDRWWEFKIEPRLTNPEQAYYEFVGHVSSMKIDQMVLQMQSIFEDFRNTYVEGIRKLGLVPGKG